MSGFSGVVSGFFGVKLSDLFPHKRYKCIHGELAQMVERPLRMRDVPGSIPEFSKFRVLYSNQYISAGRSQGCCSHKISLWPALQKNRLIDFVLAIK